MRTLICAACTALLAVAMPVRAADTVQDFSALFFPPPPPVTYVIRDNGGGGGGPHLQGGGWDGTQFMRLTDAVNDSFNGLYFSEQVGGGWDLLQVSFEYNAPPGVGGADGIGIVYLPSSTYGADAGTGSNPAFSEDANVAGAVGFGLDTWNNGPGDGFPGGTEGSLPDSVSAHFSGSTLANVPMSALGKPDNWLENGSPKRVDIFLENVGGSIEGSVVITDVANPLDFAIPFANAPIPGMTNYAGRLAFHARTGGENASHDIDNVLIEHTVGATVTTFTENFNGPLPTPTPPTPPVILGGTPFTLGMSDIGALTPGASVQPDVAGTVGPGSGYGRLTAETGSQVNTLAFDQTASNSNLVTIDFDLRIQEDGQFGRADGASVMLLDVATWGSSGAFTGPPGFISEEPNAAGVFGMAFDTFDNGAETVNSVSLHNNGGLVAQVILDQFAEIDLVNTLNRYHHVSLVLEEVAGGVEVTAILTDGTDGSTHFPFLAHFIPGMNLDGKRVAFAARTGGAADRHEIDNVNVAFIPEPATMTLLALGAAGLIRRRRSA